VDLSAFGYWLGIDSRVTLFIDSSNICNLGNMAMW
jgi:hypothetical protein